MSADDLISCPSLLNLDLSNNNMSQGTDYCVYDEYSDVLSVPPELGLMTQLKSLSLKGNPQKAVRLAILDKPTSSILEYLRSRIPQ